MAKRCERGKSCGATCINGQKACELDLSPQTSASLSAVRDKLVEMRNVIVANYRPLVTPEETAKWLLEHQEELATWGMTDFNVSEAIAQRPAYITFGVEPGVGQAVSSSLPQLRDTFKQLQNSPEILDQGKGATGPWANQILKANTYKIVLEGSPKVASLTPKLDPKRNELLKRLASAGMSTEDMVKQDSLSQLRLLSEGSTTMSPGGFWDKRISSEADKPSNVSWSAANGLIAKGAGVSGQGAISFNPSGLWKPSKTYGQFKELFQTAGYSTKEMGPFASNGKWYKYSSQKMGDQVMRLVREAQPKLMYFGGEESARVRDRIAQEFPDRGTFTLRAKMKDGVKTVSKSYEYFLYPRPDGTHTVALFGPHPGAMGMASNRKIMEGTGEVAKALHEKGVLPEKVVHGEVSTGKG